MASVFPQQPRSAGTFPSPISGEKNHVACCFCFCNLVLPGRFFDISIMGGRSGRRRRLCRNYCPLFVCPLLLLYCRRGWCVVYSRFCLSCQSRPRELAQGGWGEGHRIGTVRSRSLAGDVGYVFFKVVTGAMKGFVGPLLGCFLPLPLSLSLMRCDVMCGCLWDVGVESWFDLSLPCMALLWEQSSFGWRGGVESIDKPNPLMQPNLDLEADIYHEKEGEGVSKQHFVQHCLFCFFVHEPQKHQGSSTSAFHSRSRHRHTPPPPEKRKKEKKKTPFAKC